MKIIIADDHLVVRFGLTEMLRSSFPSAEIEEADDAEGLFKKMLRGKYDLVILDLSMPGRSGLEALQQIKTSYPGTPVLIFSGQPEEQYAVRVLKAGASGYLTKNSAPDEVIKAVNALLLGKKYITPSIADQLVLSLDEKRNKLPHELLSTREFEVMKLIASGKTVSEIAEQMMLSVTTISTYRARICHKMNLGSNAQIVVYCIENKLL
ncbi:MAG: response regulator transcription factor [Agriterribacter sp.]